MSLDAKTDDSLQWDYSSNATSVGKKSKDVSEDLAEPWQARRSAILAKYITSEKLSIVTSFLPGGEKGFIIFFPFFRKLYSYPVNWLRFSNFFQSLSKYNPVVLW